MLYDASFIQLDNILHESKYQLPQPSYNFMYDSGCVLNIVRISINHILRMNRILEAEAKVSYISNESDEEAQAMDEGAQAMDEEAQAMDKEAQAMDEEAQAMDEEGQAMDEEGQAMDEEGQAMHEEAQAMHEDDVFFKFLISIGVLEGQDDGMVEFPERKELDEVNQELDVSMPELE